MNAAEQVIADELNSLRKKRTEAVELIERLDAQIEILARVRGNLPQEETEPTVEAHPGPGGNNGSAEPVRPTRAIRQYIAKHPGSSRAEIITAVAAMKLDSQADSKLKVVDACLRQLVRNEQVIQNGDGFRLAVN